MPETKSIGVPTAKGMGAAFGDYGIGLVGGLIYSFVQGFLGKGVLGSLAAPLAAASVVKGTRGTVISTVAGFAAGQDLLAGGGLGNWGGLLGGGGNGNETPAREVM